MKNKERKLERNNGKNVVAETKFGYETCHEFVGGKTKNAGSVQQHLIDLYFLQLQHVS